MDPSCRVVNITFVHCCGRCFGGLVTTGRPWDPTVKRWAAARLSNVPRSIAPIHARPNKCINPQDTHQGQLVSRRRLKVTSYGMAYLAIYVLFFLSEALVEYRLGHLPKAVLLAIGALLAAASWGWGLRENQQAIHLLKWLQANQHHVENGGATYRGHMVTPGTVLKRYRACVSLGFFTATFYSRFYLPEQKSPGAAFATCLISLAFGWWALPWGPLSTPQIIYANLSRGYRQCVFELVHVLDFELGNYVHNRAQSVQKLILNRA